MRIVGTIDNPVLCEQFSSFLNQKGIEHRVELVVNKDWGSDKYGAPACQIWVIDEDQVDEVIDHLKSFKDNPDDEKFKARPGKDSKTPSFRQMKPDKIIPADRPPPGQARQQPAPITFYIILLCSVTFIWGAFTMPRFAPIWDQLPVIAVFSPNINKDLMYDWPEAYSIVDEVVRRYGVESLEKPQDLPPDGKMLLNQYFETPVWRGFYPKLLALFGATDESLQIEAPMFEKIRQGEIWRLVTPAILHGGIFHILFNMLWLLVLGKQMEERLKPFRYILFIVIAAIIPNTLQYLMSGPNFLGFSGVLTAMLGYIWIRQETAPWEGYVLQRSTLMLIAIFIFGLFAIQLIAFFVQVFFDVSFNLPIANTAHLSGAILGIILGRTKFFAWRT